MSVEGTPHPMRKWEAHSRGERLARFAVYLGTAAAVVWSARYVEIIPEFLYDAPDQMVDLFGRMWPPDLKYLGPTLTALVETIHIATLGTLMALAMALPVAVAEKRRQGTRAGSPKIK